MILFGFFFSGRGGGLEIYEYLSFLRNSLFVYLFDLRYMYKDNKRLVFL